MDRLFALKQILPSLTAQPACAQALSAAARSYGSLEHPRIARLAELTVTQGQTFTATELVIGLDVGRLVAECRISGSPLPPGGGLGLLIGAARAVGYAHGRGLAHLGLCPQNLVVSVDGDIKVTDFGILAACMPERPAEDPRLAHRVAYLAPEQLVGEPTSAATDVFALGAIGIEMVTGSPAFRGETPLDVQQAVLSGRVNDPSLPGAIVRVLQRCLARAPFERFPDARALADALEAALRSSPVRGTRLDVADRVNAVLAHIASLNEGGLSGVVSLPSGAPPPMPPPVPARPPTVLGPEVISTPSSLPDNDRLDTAEFLRDDAFEEESSPEGSPRTAVRREDTSDDEPSGAVVHPVLELSSRSHRVTDAPMIAATLRGFSSGATPRPMPPSSSGPMAAAVTPPPMAAAVTPPPMAAAAPRTAAAPAAPSSAPPSSSSGPPPVPVRPPPSGPLPSLGARPAPPRSGPLPSLGAPPPSGPLPSLGPPPPSGPLPSLSSSRAAGSFATVVPARPTSQAEPRLGAPPERRSAPQLSETRAGSSAGPDIEVTTARVGALVSAWDEAMETFEQPTRVNEALSASLLSQANRTGPAPRLDLAELLAPATPGLSAPATRLPSAAGSFEAMPGAGPEPDPWAPVASVSTVFPESVPKRPSSLDLASSGVAEEAEASVGSRPWPAPESSVRSAPLSIPKIPPARPSQPPPLLGAAGAVRTTGPMASPLPYPQAPPPGNMLIGSPFGAPPPEPPLQSSNARWLWLLLGVVIIAGSAVGAYALFFGGFSQRRGTLALDPASGTGSTSASQGVGHPSGALDARAPTPDARAATVAAAAPADAATSSADAAPTGPAAASGGPQDPPRTAPEADGLSIESKPSGARVYIDGADQGVTPLRLPGPADRHSAVLFLAGHELATLDMDKNGTYKVELKEITPLGGPAGIKVRCKLKDRYYISIDGKPTGSLCPSERLEVDKGEHVVETYDLITEARRQFRVLVKDTSRSTRVRVD